MTIEEKNQRKKEYLKQYREKNKEKLKTENKLYREQNKEKLKEMRKEYYEKNKTIILEKISKYQKENKETINKVKNAYRKNRRQTDPLYNLTHNIRALIKISFTEKGLNKNSKTSTILGCSFEDFKQHIEALWSHPNNLDENGNVWMNWDNKGLYNGECYYGWDIDHVIPVSTGITEEEVMKLNHFTNLQPLCSKINRDVKKNKLTF